MSNFDPITWIRKTDLYQKLRNPWFWHLDAHMSRKGIHAVKGRHTGETGVVLATGPSLHNTDFTPYRDMPVIGLNRIYLANTEIPISIDYLVCINDLLLQQCANEIAELDVPCFISWASRDYFTPRPRITYLNAIDSFDFEKNLLKRVPVGSTVTFVALQLAYWMGFQKIIILGLDHQYSLERHEEELAPHQTAQRQFSDTNHFHTEYFGAGMKWQLPDLAESERAYAEAERAFSADGRKIVNATPGSQLNIFERLDSPDHKS